MLTAAGDWSALPGNPGNPGKPGGPGAPGGPLITEDTSAGSPGGPAGPMIVLPRSPGGPCYQCKQYKYECTVHQELKDAAAYAPGRRRFCTHRVAALLCVK